MFRRRHKDKLVSRKSLEVPNIDMLQGWVLKLVKKLELEEGNFTILPAYGGVLIYIRNEGITWVPYSEIKLVESLVDKNKFVESSAMLGGLAIIKATGGMAIPLIFLPSFVARAWYRSIARPSPKKIMTFLQSMIDEVIVERAKINKKILDRFEKSPVKSVNIENDELITYTLHIKQKYFSKETDEIKFVKFFKYLSSAFTGIEIPIFPVHPNADVMRFIEDLKNEKINVKLVDKTDIEIELPKDGLIIN